jgi:site-specific DNA-methyltransferase (adenine-specific)/adenine-specific DNA-methyltransferase
LVYVDSPNKVTGYSTLQKAREFRESYLGGGWNKVVILGWNFPDDIAQTIRGLNDDRLEVLVIPPDLLDRLKSKATALELMKSGKVRFSSLQYLTVKPIVKRDYNEQTAEYRVDIENYVLLSPDALPLEDSEKEELTRIMKKDPLSLIEYWSIDPEYDGKVFRSRWQDYRENSISDKGPWHVTTTAKLLLPKSSLPRTFCIKAVDVFGFEAATTQRVP